VEFLLQVGRQTVIVSQEKIQNVVFLGLVIISGVVSSQKSKRSGEKEEKNKIRNKQIKKKDAKIIKWAKKKLRQWRRKQKLLTA
jgi:hypothetical protein